MKITVKYERQNFFGGYECAEATTICVADTIKKAFAGFKKDRSFVVFISEENGTNETKFYYDTITDFENGYVTMQYSRSFWSHDTPVQITFKEARKMAMDLVKKTA